MKSKKCLILALSSLIVAPFAFSVSRGSDDPYQYRDFPETGSAKTANNSAAVATGDPKDVVAPPPLRVNPTLREDYGLGTSVTVYGGVTALQEGTLKITSPDAPGAEIRASTKSILGEVGGIKMAFTWMGFGAIASHEDSQTVSFPDLIEPCLATDFFWSGYRYKASGNGTTTSDGVAAAYDGTLRAGVDTYTFCVEPTVKFNLGAFRPYVGFGVGGTYIDADHASVNGNASALGLTARGSQALTGSSSDVDFTVEGLAGVEYFFDPHWALSLDYKFVYFVSPSFHGDIPSSTINYHLSGLGENMLTSGISYYF